jgi:ribosomal protein S18 acetylase RimI-like enzyme
MILGKMTPKVLPQISIRPVLTEDDDFLLQLYASTRADELASCGWTPAQQAAFIRMQFDIRQRGYTAAYPSAEVSVLSLANVKAGSLIVSRGDREIRIVDIALMPEFRNRGIGSEMIRRLILESTHSGTPLRLSVVRGNAAMHLYERLGFVAIGDDAMYCEMEYTPKHAI